jgi:hypothetical protein
MCDRIVTTLARRWPRGQILRVRCGSAFVPVYTSDAQGFRRYTVAFYRDGRRVRRTFTDLEKAKKEAKLAADRIQAGLAQTHDLRPHEREAYRSALRERRHRRRQLGRAVHGAAGRVDIQKDCLHIVPVAGSHEGPIA